MRGLDLYIPTGQMPLLRRRRYVAQSTLLDALSYSTIQYGHMHILYSMKISPQGGLGTVQYIQYNGEEHNSLLSDCMYILVHNSILHTYSNWTQIDTVQYSTHAVHILYCTLTCTYIHTYICTVCTYVQCTYSTVLLHSSVVCTVYVCMYCICAKHMQDYK